MMIDTGSVRPDAYSAAVSGDGRISLRRFDVAERFHRKVIAALYACDTPTDLEAYIAAEDELLEALFLAHPDLMAAVQDAIDTQRACLAPRPHSAPADPPPTASALQPAHTGNRTTIMFDIDTGSSGSEGPWLAWSARGTQDGVIPPQSFYIRDGEGKTRFDGFQAGVVLDIQTMKTGWQRSEGVVGQAPDWRWNRSLSRFEEQPGEDYKKGFSLRCAIGNGLTATWEQAGAGAWGAFVGLVPQLQQAPSPDKLPVVKITGVKVEKFKRGSTATPTLTVVKWVDRPACLDAEGIATEPAPQPKAAPQPAPKAAPQPSAELEDTPF